MDRSLVISRYTATTTALLWYVRVDRGFIPDRAYASIEAYSSNMVDSQRV